MASATEILAEPFLDIPVITATTSAKKGYTHDELAHFRIGHDDIHQIVLTIYNFDKKGQNRHLDVRRDILDATFEDAIDQTPTFTITLRDADWEFLNTGALEHNIDVNPGNLPRRFYRLDNVEVADEELTLTFATRNAVYIAKHKRAHKASRGKMTRAQFIKSLVREVKKTRIPFYCPQLTKRQKFAKREHTTGERKRKREKGFSDSDKITSKHNATNQLQRDCQESVIRAGDDLNAPKNVIICAVMTVIQESNSGAEVGRPGAKFVGPFQQHHSYGWPGTGDAYKDAKGFYAKAIPYWKKHKDDMTLGMIAQQVQGASPSLNPLNAGFAQEADGWRDEAEHSVNAYSGLEVGNAGSPDSTEVRKKYEFMVGEPDGPYQENYMAAIYRLADEVHWRAYWVRDALHYMSEEDLFKAKARARLRRDYDGVERVSFNWDHGKKINEMTVSVRMDRWVCPVGTVVVFDEGGPARGRWLVTNIRRSMFDELGEITLKKPMRERAEPVKLGTRDPGADGSGGGGSGGPIDLSNIGGIEAVRSSMSPYYIINHFVVPRARVHHMNTGIDLKAILLANAPGKHVPNSDHYGPRWLKWAVDMSNGTSPTRQMDDLASELIMAFDLPDLENPLATRKDGLVLNNLVQKDHKGFRFQLIYRTDLGANGGDHYNHVHFGVRKISTGPSHQQ